MAKIPSAESVKFISWGAICEYLQEKHGHDIVHDVLGRWPFYLNWAKANGVDLQERDPIKMQNSYKLYKADPQGEAMQPEDHNLWHYFHKTMMVDQKTTFLYLSEQEAKENSHPAWVRGILTEIWETFSSQFDDEVVVIAIHDY